jgi:hypothetical protein
MNCLDTYRALRLRIAAQIRTPDERALWQEGQKFLTLKAAITGKQELKHEPFPEHPQEAAARERWIKEIYNFPRTVRAQAIKRRVTRVAPAGQNTKLIPVTIAFTDSLCAIPGTAKLDQIDLLFGLSGSGGLNTLQRATYLRPFLEDAGLLPEFVIVGCDIGNMLLGRWDYSYAIQTAIDSHRGMRVLFPSATLIRYGLPPTLDPYVEAHFWQSELDLARIVASDRKSVFVSLDKMGRWGFLATSRNSAEGIHLSDNGVIRLNDSFREAKTITTFPAVVRK